MGNRGVADGEDRQGFYYRAKIRENRREFSVSVCADDRGVTPRAAFAGLDGRGRFGPEHGWRAGQIVEDHRVGLLADHESRHRIAADHGGRDLRSRESLQRRDVSRNFGDGRRDRDADASDLMAGGAPSEAAHGIGEQITATGSVACELGDGYARALGCSPTLSRRSAMPHRQPLRSDRRARVLFQTPASAVLGMPPATVLAMKA